jgi:PAS domain S-box-containing protein
MAADPGRPDIAEKAEKILSKAWVRGVAVFAVGAGLTFATWGLAARIEANHLREEWRAVASALAFRIADRLDGALRRLALGADGSETPGLLAVGAWDERGFVWSEDAAPAGAEELRGAVEAGLARAGPGQWLAPVATAAAGEAVLVFAPAGPDATRGAIGLVSLAAIPPGSAAPMEIGASIRAVAEDGGTVVLSEPATTPTWGAEESVAATVAGLPWRIVVAWRADPLAPFLGPLPLVVLGLGLLVSAAGAILLALFLSRDGRQRRQIAMMAARLAESSAELARTALLAQERSTALEAVLRTTVHGIVTTDEEGVILSFNRAAEGIFGYRADEVIGSNVSRLMPKPYAAEHDGYIRRYLETGEARIIGIGREVQGLRRDGTVFPLELAVSESRSDGRRWFTGILEDISLRKEREASLQAALRDLNAFAHSVSHDLRAPLRTIQGFAGALLEDYHDRIEAEGRVYLERIIVGVRRMDALIGDLLLYARLSGSELGLGTVYLDDAVAGALDQLDTAIKDAKAVVTVEGPLPAVRGHQAALVQALANLVGNALKFVPSGRVPCVRVSAVPSGRWTRITVADNGIGIAREHHERIFEVFERLHGPGDYAGTGIGLSIVKRAVEKMGGRVGVDSTPGEGSHFWIELPGARTEAEPTNAAWGGRMAGR